MKRIIIVIAATAALGLAGCSSSAQSAPSGSGPTAPTGGSTAARGAGRTPGVSGLVAAVTGTTAQVQGPNQQTAVSWTRTTRFTDQVVVSASAVKVGECVMARPGRGTGGRHGSAGTSTSVAAASVELLPMQGGTCSFGGPTGRTGTRPSGAPTGTGTTGPGGASRRGLGVVGTVTAVGSGQFTVTPVAPAGATGVTAPVSVSYTASTTFTRLATATPSAVRVGVCVAAQGRTDATGALTARTINVSAPVNGTCESGSGGGGRGPGGGRGTGGGAATSTAGAGNA